MFVKCSATFNENTNYTITDPRLNSLTLDVFGAYNVLFSALAALQLQQSTSSYFSTELYLSYQNWRNRDSVPRSCMFPQNFNFPINTMEIEIPLEAICFHEILPPLSKWYLDIEIPQLDSSKHIISLN